jgi:hypothetical protein
LSGQVRTRAAPLAHKIPLKPDISAGLVARDDVSERAAIVVTREAAILQARFAPHSRRHESLARLGREGLVLAFFIAGRRRFDLHKPNLEAGVERKRIAIGEASDAALFAAGEIRLPAAGRKAGQAQRGAAPCECSVSLPDPVGSSKRDYACRSHPPIAGGDWRQARWRMARFEGIRPAPTP